MPFDLFPALGYALWTQDLRTHIDADRSQNWAWDALRSCATPVRKFDHNIFSGPLTSLDGWTLIHPIAGPSIGIVSEPDPDPLIPNVLDLQTGSTAGAMAGVQRVLPATVPWSFGLMVMPKLCNVGSNPADALLVQQQTASGVYLVTRYYDSHCDVFLDNQWKPGAPFGGNLWTEWWHQCNWNAGTGQHDVMFYAGTERVGTASGTLPSGNPNNNNLLAIIQQGATPGRHSKVSIVNVGDSQLPLPMNLCSPLNVAAASPTRGYVAILAENISQNLCVVGPDPLNPNPAANFFSHVSKDDTGTWAPVALEDIGPFLLGEIDNAKPMRLLAGSGDFAPGSGGGVRYTIETTQDGLFAIQGATGYYT